ncbi:MAG: hypothetical protein IJ635_01780 [Bacteroidaceae bacterium]|nr:hypothetical protein [Bacteroidaceae bacterium]
MFGEEMWEEGGTRRKHRLERGEEISGEGGDKRRKWGCENGGFGEVLLKLKLDFIKFKLDLYKFKLNFCKFKFDFIKSKFSFKRGAEGGLRQCRSMEDMGEGEGREEP